MKTRCLFALLSTSIVLGLTNPALADPTKQECLDAFEKQQSMRAQNKLRTARDAAKVCASSSCGRIAPDCAKSALEIAALIPTIVFEAKDGDGRDIAAVKVSMDGQKIADKLEGSALEVDIGDHEFVFEANGQTVKQRFVIREGDKVRHEKVTIGQPTPVAATPTPPPTPTPTPPPPTTVDTPKPADPPPPAPDTGSTGTGQRVAGAVIGAVGLVGAAIGTYYLVSYSSDNSAFPTDGQKLCGGIGQGTTCSAAQDLKSSIESESVKGGVALGIGGALIVTGLIVFLTAPSHHAAPTASLQLVPTVGHRSGGLVLGGAF